MVRGLGDASVRLAFVIPRFAAGIVGGAEYHARQLAGRLIGRGHAVTVLTTCAVNHYTWDNALPAGAADVDGIPVLRYPVTVPRDVGVMRQLQLSLDSGFTLPDSLEEAWVRQTGYSEPLLEAIDGCADSLDALIFTPYLFASTVFGARVRPDKSLVQPLLHDEAYARFECVQAALRDAAGLLWISAGERALAERLMPGLPPGRLVGAGVALPAQPFDAAAERRHLGLEGIVVSYAGRREGAKNFPLVAEVVAAANLARHRQVTLVAMGEGPANLPAVARPFVRDLGRVDERTKLAVFAASTAVLNLSLFESFSYVVMEAWSVGTPVIVHAGCAVTRGHCETAGGGLWVGNVEEGVEAVLRLGDDDALRKQLGDAGRRHVAREAVWPVVIDRMEAAMIGLLPGQQ
jgi:glycosyltransferase involved in cell wall biosynthesis